MSGESEMLRTLDGSFEVIWRQIYCSQRYEIFRNVEAVEHAQGLESRKPRYKNVSSPLPGARDMPCYKL